MALLDHNGESEFQFSKDKVFDALCISIPKIDGMKIETADKLIGRIMVKSAISLYSWGENIPIQLTSISEDRTKIQITSSPKTGIMFGGAFDMGKNRKNIEQILLKTSQILSQGQINLEENNQIINSPNYSNKDNQKMESINQKWYDKKWLVILLCIIFFPVGLYALWMNSTISKGWKIGVSVIIGLMVIGTFGGNDKKGSNKTDVSSEPPVNTSLTQEQKDSISNTEKLTEIQQRKDNTISASNLVQAYVENEVRADENYKNKSFYVEGNVTDIKKDILDKIYVTLEGSEMFREVQCYFDNKETASKIEKGMRVTFYGKCDGLMMNVMMKNCELVSNIKDLEKEVK